MACFNWRKYSSLELSNYADKFIKNVLETVNGVGSIFIGGERRYAMRLWLDPKKWLPEILRH